jgi:hypothetical protein
MTDNYMLECYERAMKKNKIYRDALIAFTKLKEWPEDKDESILTDALKNADKLDTR